MEDKRLDEEVNCELILSNGMSYITSMKLGQAFFLDVSDIPTAVKILIAAKRLKKMLDIEE